MTELAQILLWIEKLAAQEAQLLASGRCNNPLLTQERWLVYQGIAMGLRDGIWKKPPP